MVNPSSYHVLGECKPREVVILMLFFCISTPRGQLELMMKRAVVRHARASVCSASLSLACFGCALVALCPAMSCSALVCACTVHRWGAAAHCAVL
jgi:hypothetical protein